MASIWSSCACGCELCGVTCLPRRMQDCIITSSSECYVPERPVSSSFRGRIISTIRRSYFCLVGLCSVNDGCSLCPTPDSLDCRHFRLPTAIAIVVGESIALGEFLPRNYGEIAWLSSFACVWAGMATIAMCEVLRYDEPAVRFPESGGEHLYLCPNTGTGWYFSTAG